MVVMVPSLRFLSPNGNHCQFLIVSFLFYFVRLFSCFFIRLQELSWLKGLFPPSFFFECGQNGFFFWWGWGESGI